VRPQTVLPIQAKAETEEEMTEQAKGPTTEKELLPCPFCGGKASHYSYDAYSVDSSYDCVGCEKCGVRIPYFNDSEMAQAIEAWNRRATHAQGTERLREALSKLVKACEELDTHVEPNGVFDFCAEGSCNFCNALNASNELLSSLAPAGMSPLGIEASRVAFAPTEALRNERGEAAMDLTPEEAFKEARRRWGEAGSVVVGKVHGELDYEVGHWDEENVHYYPQGSGRSFREAFAAADKEDAR
jgi:Lar family restriction alleviation protein